MKHAMIMVNDRQLEPLTPPGNPALDFIREELSLTGTKEGCREGDCGACAVLVGEMKGGVPRYRAYPSCLLAMGDISGKHLVTIEGLTGSAPEGLTPVMRAFLEENASQCGFCSPGFIIALTAWLAESSSLDLSGAMKAVDGNLCRCTGYGSIRRAAARLAGEFSGLPEPGTERLKILVRRHVLPPSVLAFIDLTGTDNEKEADPPAGESAVFLGGGTDYFVRNPEPDSNFSPVLLASRAGMVGVREIEVMGRKWLGIGAAAKVSDFFASPLLEAAVPGLKTFETGFASTLVRNLATVGGNLVNASPVADITAMLLALGAKLEIRSIRDDAARYIDLDEFYLDYKKTALNPGEYLALVLIPGLSGGAPYFSFEKISKRENLDIAAVNTAMAFRLEAGICRDVRISAGGIAPIPRLLPRASALVEGKNIGAMDTRERAVLARLTAETAASETAPIDDVRGTAGYRTRMLSRLVTAHFLRFFGEAGLAEELYP